MDIFEITKNLQKFYIANFFSTQAKKRSLSKLNGFVRGGGTNK